MDQPIPQNNIPIKSSKIKEDMVETFAGDVAGAIEESHGGLVKQLIKEEETRDAEKIAELPEYKLNNIFMIGSLLLFILAGGIIFYFIPAKTAPAPVVLNMPPLMIFTDQNTDVDLSDLNANEVLQKINDASRDSLVKRGGIEGFNLKKSGQLVGLRKFVEITESNFVPGSLDFVADNLLVGTMNIDDTRHGTFMIIKARSMQDIFGPMRLWESKIFADLHDMFGVNLNADTSYLSSKEFDDEIIENKNARVLHDKDGKIVLIYIFADDTHVVITDDNDLIHEVITRLAGSRAQ
jgi:hypothetical protein